MLMLDLFPKRRFRCNSKQATAVVASVAVAVIEVEMVVGEVTMIVALNMRVLAVV